MKRFVLFSLACLFISVAALAQQQNWTVDNGVVRKTIQFTPEYGLEVANWSDQTANFNFVSPEFAHRGYNEFQFTANDKNVSGKSADVSLTGAQEEHTVDGIEHLD